MDSLFHSIQVSTLGAWISVAGFGAIGISINPWQVPSSPPPGETETIVDLTPSEFVIDAGSISNDADLGSDPSSTDPVENQVQEILPTPDVLAPLDDLAPLPEIPEIPELAPPPVKKTAVAEAPPQPSGSSTSPRSSSRSSSGQSNSSRGTSASGSQQGSGGMSTSSRLAAGRMPAPRYPSSSKRKGETGSVTVSFTIGSDGKVIAASVSSPSPYPALNESAVQAVRGWRFPPGGVLKTQRRLDFVLRN